MRHLSATLLLVLLGACATSREVQPEGPRVEAFTIEGTGDLSEGELKEKVSTTEPPWYRRLFPWLPIGEDPRFDPTAFQADLRRIERYYQAQGYFQADVVSEQVLGPGGEPVDEDAPLPDSVRLRVQVREGAPTLLAEVRIEGMDDLPPQERARVLDELPLREGERFREEPWEETKTLIASRLREQGYAEARVEGEVLVDVEEHRARARLVVEPGRRYVFGKIFVVTDPRPVVNPQRIIEQAREALKEGTPYSESALAEAQARVFRMGVFGAVKVNRGLVNRAAGTVPVIVDVREAPFHSVRLGGGLGADAVRNEVRLLAEYTDRNFFGGLRRFSTGGRVGYARVPPFSFQLGRSGGSNTDGGSGEEAPQPVAHGLIFNTYAELEQPRILFRDLALQARLFAERNFEQAFTYEGGGGRLGLPWTPSPYFTLITSYNFELYRQSGPLGTSAGAANINIGCPRGKEDACFVTFSYLEQLLEWDRRNDRISPKRGYYLALSLQEAGGVLGGTFSYVRLQPELRLYRSFGDDGQLTFATRVRAGTLLAFPSADDRAAGTQANPATPILARFFSGGANSMRGFNGRRLSPQQLRTLLPDDPRLDDADPLNDLEVQDAVPIGGRGLFEASVELRYQLFGPLSVAGFFDMGKVSVERFGQLENGDIDVPAYLADNMHFAAGAGLRYLTPVGPIRLDLAYRLSSGQPPLFEVDGVTRIPGTRRASVANYEKFNEPPFVFHLSIGEAF